MENGLAGQLITDNHFPVTDEAGQRGPDGDIPRVNFDDTKTDCNCSIRHIVMETICGGKSNGKHDSYMCTFVYSTSALLCCNFCLMPKIRQCFDSADVKDSPLVL